MIAGIGNIYVCEALFRAHLAHAVGEERSNKIDAAARGRDQGGPTGSDCAGGSSLRDHKRVDGEFGNFQHRFAVYGREGKPCPSKCGGIIRRIVRSGRSTFYCSKCQR